MPAAGITLAGSEGAEGSAAGKWLEDGLNRHPPQLPGNKKWGCRYGKPAFGASD